MPKLLMANESVREEKDPFGINIQRAKSAGGVSHGHSQRRYSDAGTCGNIHRPGMIGFATKFVLTVLKCATINAGTMAVSGLKGGTGILFRSPATDAERPKLEAYVTDASTSAHAWPHCNCVPTDVHSRRTYPRARKRCVRGDQAQEVMVPTVR